MLWLSYSLRLGTQFRPTPTQIALMALAPLVALPVFLRFGLYRAVIRYLPERAIWTILQAMTLATLIWVVVLFLAEVVAHRRACRARCRSSTSSSAPSSSAARASPPSTSSVRRRDGSATRPARW